MTSHTTRQATIEFVILVVSLDSVSLPWLEQVMDSGRVPALSSIVRQGRQIAMQGVQLAGIAYPTLYSGLAPSQHGIYFPYQWSAEHQRVRGWNHLEKPASIFERIDQAGLRAVVIDPPEMTPLQLRQGFIQSGWQLESRVILQSWTTSPRISSLLAQRFGSAKRGDEVFGKPSVNGLLYLREILMQAPGRLEKAAAYFLGPDTDPPDLLWLNFPALHIAGHQLFDLILLDSAAMEAGQRQAIESALLDLLEAYDRAIGRVLSLLPAGADILVFFSKGMGPTYGYHDLFPEMLRLILGGKTTEAPVQSARNWIPPSWRAKAASLLSDDVTLRLTARLSSPRCDWNTTRAFALPSDVPGFIRVNLQGREKHGIVREADRSALLEEIEAGLRTFTNLDGSPCIQNVALREQLMGDGPRRDNFPDQVLFWHEDQPTNGLTGIRSPRFGEIYRTGVGSGRAGSHCQGAMALAVAGAAHRVTDRDTADTLDIPATVLSALGVPCSDLPGHPLLQARPS